MIGFECLVLKYPTCGEFDEIYSFLAQDPPTAVEGFTIVDGFLFRGNYICILNTSLCDHLIWEMHVGGATRLSARDMNIFFVEDKFYWSSVKKDAARVVSHCRVCQVAKCRNQNTRLYSFACTVCAIRAS